MFWKSSTRFDLMNTWSFTTIRDFKEVNFRTHLPDAIKNIRMSLPDDFKSKKVISCPDFDK
jgi:hypothetical protein